MTAKKIRLLRFCLTSVIAGMFLFIFNPTVAKTPEISRQDTILVKFKNQAEVKTIKLTGEQTMEQALAYYKALPSVDFVEPDFLYQASDIPNDKYYGNQWYLKRIKAVQAWDFISSSPDIIVAVIDSGVQYQHPDLRDNIFINTKEVPDNKIDDDQDGYVDNYYGWDFVNKSPDPSPKFSLGFTEEGVSHGTAIAGVLSAVGNNREGITGVSWKTKLMILKALDDKGQTDASKVIEAINYAVNHGAQIINLSFAGFGYSQGVQQSIRRAYDAGVIIVSAGGNEESGGFGYSTDRQPIYPACHDDEKTGENLVIGVSATGPLDQKAYFSSYGHKCIDLSAPGVSIFTTALFTQPNNVRDKIFNKYYDGYWSGTSFAVPMVSGVLALILQADPGLKPQKAVEILLNNTDNINALNPQFANLLGRGRLNAQKAIESAIEEKNRTIGLLLSSVNDGRLYFSDFGKKDFSVLTDLTTYFKQGFNLASGNLNNGDSWEIVATARAGGPPSVLILDNKGNVQKSFLAYEENFLGGVQIALGDVNADNNLEIITAPGIGRKPEIKIFNQKGILLNSFLAYDKSFFGGVNVSSGVLDNGREAKIVTSPLSNGGSHIRVFNWQGRVLSQFFAFDQHISGGWKAIISSTYDNTRNNKNRIMIASGPKISSYIKIFNQDGKLEWRFAPFGTRTLDGISFVGGDLNNDGQAEAIMVPLSGEKLKIKIYKDLRIFQSEFDCDLEKPIDLSMAIFQP